jgi:hypothetical protein
MLHLRCTHLCVTKARPKGKVKERQRQDLKLCGRTQQISDSNKHSSLSPYVITRSRLSNFTSFVRYTSYNYTPSFHLLGKKTLASFLKLDPLLPGLTETTQGQLPPTSFIVLEGSRDSSKWAEGGCKVTNKQARTRTSIERRAQHSSVDGRHEASIIDHALLSGAPQLPGPSTSCRPPSHTL